MSFLSGLPTEVQIIIAIVALIGCIYLPEKGVKRLRDGGLI